jgi:hypothetical protein
MPRTSVSGGAGGLKALGNGTGTAAPSCLNPNTNSAAAPKTAPFRHPGSADLNHGRPDFVEVDLERHTIKTRVYSLYERSESHFSIESRPERAASPGRVRSADQSPRGRTGNRMAFARQRGCSSVWRRPSNRRCIAPPLLAPLVCTAGLRTNFGASMISVHLPVKQLRNQTKRRLRSRFFYAYGSSKPRTLERSNWVRSAKMIKINIFRYFIT